MYSGSHFNERERSKKKSLVFDEALLSYGLWPLTLPEALPLPELPLAEPLMLPLPEPLPALLPPAP